MEGDPCILDDISHRHGLYDQIQRLLKASHGKDNSFIDYIAEERLRYIAAKASTMLQVMTSKGTLWNWMPNPAS